MKPTGIKNPNSVKFRFGNYNRYYGKRLPVEGQTEGEADPRLNFFESAWFENKRVLDIGCNIGLVTLHIAKNFRPSLITGVDIDQHLIGVARKNVRHYLPPTDQKNFGIKNEQGDFPTSFGDIYGPIDAPGFMAGNSNQPPHNVLFKVANYVLDSEKALDMVSPEFDVILALSITKWIHLNWGDEGLKLFFKRIFANLQPGGRFILEPQPFASYKRRKKLTPEILENYKKINFLPDQFEAYLLSSEVGFESCHIIGNPKHCSKGFRRPIFMLTKKLDSTPVATSTQNI